VQQSLGAHSLQTKQKVRGELQKKYNKTPIYYAATLSAARMNDVLKSLQYGPTRLDLSQIAHV
jgi:hypothetical protein